MFCSTKHLSVLEDTGEKHEDLEQGMCPAALALLL